MMYNLKILSSSNLSASGPTCTEADVFETWRDNAGAVCAYGYVCGRQRWMELPGVALFRFDTSGEEILAFAPPSRSPELILDSYYRTVLPMALQSRGQEVLHASAVMINGGVVGFCAVSETGKSTVAHALALKGHPAWADDAVVLELSKGSVVAEPLPFRVRLRPASEAYLRRLHLADTLHERTTAHTSRCPVNAIFVLERHSAPRVQVDRLSAIQAFTELLKNAYCFTLKESERKRIMVENYTRLASSVPVMRLRFPSGLEYLDSMLDAISEVLRETVLATCAGRS